MSRKNLLLLAIALILFGVAIYNFTKDYFAPKEIQISHRLMNRATFQPRARNRNPASTLPVFFGFNRKLKLTSVQVFETAELKTNQYAHPIWDLVSESNSIPMRGFSYGQAIRGMHPNVRGARPDPLLPNVPYCLVIQAGSLKAEHDFSTKPRKP